MKRIACLALTLVLLLSGCGRGGAEKSASWREQYDLGLRYLENGNYEEAILAFTAAIEINPRRAAAYVGRADAYVATGEVRNLTAARDDYETAIALDESYTEAYFGLAWVYEALDEPEKARETLEAGRDATGDPGFDERLTAAPDYSDAYRGYLALLLQNRYRIDEYNWQFGWQEEAVPTPVAVADLCGDETPELVYLRSGDQPWWAELHICTWRDGAVAELYTSQVDAQAGGGNYHRLFLASDGTLWLRTTSADAWIMYDYNRLELSPDGTELSGAELYYSYDTNEAGFGIYGAENIYEHNGEAISEEEYRAAIAALEEGSVWVVYSGLPGSEELAMTYDEARAYLRGQLADAAALDSADAEFYAGLPERFMFSSGGGGWATMLYVFPDGSFRGSYFDGNLGETGEGYPKGTAYVCDFSGRFRDPERVDEYAWSMHVAELNPDPTPSAEWIEDGTRYVASGPYGLAGADELRVYLPGAPMSALPERFVEWISMPNGWWGDNTPDTLPVHGLYNVSEELGFFSDAD